MSDGKLAHRKTLANKCSPTPLMCSFRWIKAVTESWFNHAQLAHDANEAVWKAVVHLDLTRLARPQSFVDVKARCVVVREHLVNNGMTIGTRHVLENGQAQDIVTFCEYQWLGTMPRMAWWRQLLHI